MNRMNPVRFLSAWSGAFFANMLPRVVEQQATEQRVNAPAGKGKGRRTPPARNAAIHKRAAKKAKGRAVNKARHAG